MRKSDFKTDPTIFGRSNYLVREMHAFAEAAMRNKSTAGALLTLWDYNANVLRTAVAGSVPPGVTTAPILAGDAEVGKTLTVTPGVYTGSPTVTRKWYADADEISGATGTTLVLLEAHEDKSITVKETATNANGTVVSTSNAVGPVAAEGE